MPGRHRRLLTLETLEDRWVPTASWSAPFFAPYVSTLENTGYDYAAAARNGGVKNVVMGFITADARNQPAWDGQDELGSAADRQLHQQVHNLRALGGDVMVSFGGATDATDPELGIVLGNAGQLQKAYQQVIGAYSLGAVDFDLEGSTLTTDGTDLGPTRTTSIDVRSQAIAGLQHEAAAAGKQLQVWFTLPVTPETSGLTPAARYVVHSALAHGVQIAGVNIMTMDYYDGLNYDGVNGDPSMGDIAVRLATDVFHQLQAEPALHASTAQLWHMIGITPQIGVNVPTGQQAESGVENFTLADAREVTTFARQQGIGRLSMWSLNKDQFVQGEGPDQIWEDSSGLPQQPFAYSRTFEQLAASRLSALATFVDSNDWNGGFTGYITLTNTGRTAISGWTLQFDFAPGITDIWDARLVSHSGKHYTIGNASWDAQIAPGQSISFGFNAQPGTPGTGPSHYVLNGQALTANQGRTIATFVDTNDWNGGFTGYITLTNTGRTTINGWTLQFDFGPGITDIWSAKLVSHSGKHYTIGNASWYARIAPGQSISFGFNAQPGTPGTGPSHYVFNGKSVVIAG